MTLPHNLKSPADMLKPRPVGVCDRCSQIRYLDDMEWQSNFAGNALVNLRIMVCRDRCLDTPSEFLRSPIIGPEPAPIQNARPTNYAAQNAGGTAPLTTVSEILDD